MERQDVVITASPVLVTQMVSGFYNCDMQGRYKPSTQHPAHNEQAVGHLDNLLSTAIHFIMVKTQAQRSYNVEENSFLSRKQLTASYWLA